MKGMNMVLKRKGVVLALAAAAVFPMVLVCVAAAGENAIPACSDESMASYQALASKLSSAPSDSAAMNLGPVGGSALNPVISIADGDPSRDDLYDPSCGLRDAVRFCTGANHANSATEGERIYCGELPRLRVIVWMRPITHLSFLSVFRKLDSGWQLVQDSILEPDAALIVPGDGGLHIDSVWNTSHEIWRWNGQAFALTQRWRTVSLWNGTRFEPTDLNHKGEFAGASRDCSMAAARKALGGAREPPWVRDKSSFSGGKPLIVQLVCQNLSGAPILALSIGNGPDLDYKPWLFFQRSRWRRWRQIEGVYSCLESIEADGFTSSDNLNGLPAEHDSSHDDEASSSLRFDRWRWSDGKFESVKTWFSDKRPSGGIDTCP
jgi:hypothetical protein